MRAREGQRRGWQLNLDKDLLVRLSLTLPTAALQARRDVLGGGFGDPNDRVRASLARSSPSAPGEKVGLYWRWLTLEDGAAAARGRPRPQDRIAFTCTPTFARREYYEQLLPDLRQRLESLPTPLPLTASVRVGCALRRAHQYAQARGGADPSLAPCEHCYRAGTVQLLLADYYQPRMHMACPPCVFNSFRQDALKAHPELANQIRTWNA